MAEPRFMQAKTAAAFLDTTPQTLARWVEDGVIPAPVVIGGSKRYDRNAMLQALVKRATGRPRDADEATAEIVAEIEDQARPPRPRGRNGEGL